MWLKLHYHVDFFHEWKVGTTLSKGSIPVYWRLATVAIARRHPNSERFLGITLFVNTAQHLLVSKGLLFCITLVTNTGLASVKNSHTVLYGVYGTVGECFY